jgi:tetratricopeptide (TPR) repeat protein
MVWFCGGPYAAGATTLESYSFNRDGVRMLGEKAYYPAYQNFLKALESDPLNPYLQLNLALALEASEDFERAEKAYRGALNVAGQNPALRFQVLFNLAGVQAKRKKIEDALATYQAALELNPDSVEVKTNIELLWQGGGSGDGEGENQNQKQDQKNGKGGNEPQKPDDNSAQKEKPKTPQPRPGDTEMEKRILDEIKNQEQSIRAKDYEKGAKDVPKAKDW